MGGERTRYLRREEWNENRIEYAGVNGTGNVNGEKDAEK